jgi:hypothetical protein
MTQRLVILFSFTMMNYISKSQNIIDSVYTNSVTGQSFEQFSKNPIESTKKLDLTEITNSKNKIEIRLYETYWIYGLTFCTTLYLDTTFKLARRKYWSNPARAKQGLEETNPIALLNADSIFKILIKNGVFNFGDIRNYKIVDMNLAAKGVSKMNRPIFFAGMFYVLEYKVDKKYNRIWWDNPQLCAQTCPDDPIFKRQIAIVTALGARL